MYASWFGLSEAPFSITPDPRYLYLSARHAEALAHLLYGLHGSGGFIQLTGEVGTGKTTLLRRLLAELPDDVDVALVFNPRQNRQEFLASICEELGVAAPAGASLKQLVDLLHRHLLQSHARGRRTVLIVDEAQNLAPEVLEQVRLLTNLETEKQKLLQIMLVGQPELRELLGRHELRQLAQRITARYHLQALDRDDVDTYVRHRLEIAGAPGRIFTPAAIRRLYRLTAGIPRLINVICDRALLGAWSRELRQVDTALLDTAAAEVLPRRARRRRVSGPVLTILGLGVIAAGFLLWLTRPAFLPTALPASPAGPAAQTGTGTVQLPAGPADTDTALSALFTLWNTGYTAGGEPACVQARAAGLDCLIGQGSWNHLRGLDRPAVLTLYDRQGQAYQAVLVGLDTRQARLRFGSREVRVPLHELGLHWYGEYLLLWNPPDRFRPPLGPGDRGEGVRWLHDRLSELGYLAAPGEASVYDALLTDAIRRFQADRHLNRDGIAGTRTLIHLQNALGTPGIPRLSNRVEPHVPAS